MEAKLIKVDRNGSKHYEGAVICDRCGGKGYYAIGVHNGHPVLSPHDYGVCWKCFGVGTMAGKWIERTPEYQAKLDAKREAREKAKREAWEIEQAKINAERAEREAREKAEREAEEARIKAEKAKSQHVGEIGDKLNFNGVYVRSGSWKQRAFNGYGTTTMYVHTFKDDDGNVFIWKTQNGVNLESGEAVFIKGTVKNHTEYKDEKQTELTRCKVG